MTLRQAWLGLVPALLSACSSPSALSHLDASLGGGKGVRRLASGVPFGAHGQRLDVWAPKRRDARHPLPTLIFFYGGGWNSGTRQGYAFAARAFAAQGFLVIVPDYRKVPGVRFPAFLVDAAEATAWAANSAKAYGGDPSRMLLAGHSAGAWIAAMLALDRAWLKAAGVDPEVVKGVVGLAGPYDFFPFDSPYSIEAFQGATDPDLSTQPIRHVRPDAPPMLLITGDDDRTVQPRNSRALAKALQQAGAPVRLTNYPGIGHVGLVMALSRPFRGKAPVLADSVAFLRAALKTAR